MARNRFLFKMYYIGAKKYHGSQRQLKFLTIEDCLLNSLNKKKYISDVKSSGFEAASRTDRFVSARGACFSIILEKDPILMEINSELPKEIGIWAFSEVPLSFSSRFNAVLRHYKYIVHKSLDFLRKNFSIDIEIMQKACKQLEGRHNFINFSKREKEDVNSIRELKSVELSIVDDFIIFDFKSKAFLRQQVRRMVKKILELGMKEIEYEEFLELFDSSKSISFQPADPTGLILWDITFDDEIKLKVDLKSKKRMEIYFLTQEHKFGLKHQLFRLLQQYDFS